MLNKKKFGIGIFVLVILVLGIYFSLGKVNQNNINYSSVTVSDIEKDLNKNKLKDNELGILIKEDNINEVNKIMKKAIKKYKKHKEDSFFVNVSDKDMEDEELILNTYEYMKKEDSKEAFIVNSWYNTLKTANNLVNNSTVLEYKLNNGRLLDISRSVKDRIINLAYVYLQTGNSKYAKRAYEEMYNVCTNYKDWCPANQLDNSEMTFGVAVGYNWLKNWMDDEQKEVIINGIIELGLKNALNKSQANLAEYDNETNRNMVCNGGMASSAIAVYNDLKYYKKEDFTKNDCIEIIKRAINLLPKSISCLKDGVYLEGVGYFGYGTSYLVHFLSSINNYIGTDYGISDMEELKKVSYFPIYMLGNSKKSFNFSDSAEGATYGYQLFWLADKLNEPFLGWYQAKVSSNGNVFNLLWIKKENYKTSKEIEKYASSNNKSDYLTKDRYFGGDESMVVFRNSYSDVNSIYAGIKGGYNQSTHGDLDIGSFVFDALGVRWVKDLGAEKYSIPGYFAMDAESNRWKLYGKRAEGHNTILINPDNNADQYVNAKGTIESYKFSNDEAYAIVDMEEAYFGKAISAKRGLKLFDNRKRMIIQDEITCEENSDIYWSIHTDADIVLANNSKTAYLTMKNEKGKEVKLKVDIPTQDDYYFQIRKQESMIDEFKAQSIFRAKQDVFGNYIKDENGENILGEKLVISLSNVNKARISVIFTPIYDESFENKELPKITPLKEWTGNDDTKKSPSIDKFEVSDNWNLTAKSSGGKGKLQYMFYYSLNGVKEIIKNYGEENYVEGWKPKKSGYYDLYVKVKDEFGNITEKKVSKGYMESGPIILYFQADKLSPQPLGTKIKLSAEAEGVGEIQYKFLINSGNDWYSIQDFSTSNSCEWIPSSPGKKILYVDVMDEKGNIERESINYIVN